MKETKEIKSTTTYLKEANETIKLLRDQNKILLDFVEAYKSGISSKITASLSEVENLARIRKLKRTINYDPAFKLEMIKQAESCPNIAAMLRTHNVDIHLFDHWRSQFRKFGHKGLLPKKLWKEYENKNNFEELTAIWREQAKNMLLKRPQRQYSSKLPPKPHIGTTQYKQSIIQDIEKEYAELRQKDTQQKINLETDCNIWDYNFEQ
jgi:hypothetical protein